MVQMPVGDQDAVEALEADPGLQNLPLRTLAAVHQEAEFVVHDHLGR
jgi:hypothetical protein